MSDLDAARRPHARLMSALLARDERRVSKKSLDPLCASFFVASVTPLRGMVLMLHGFTAAPWQYRPLASFLSAQGLACLAARLPGHGAIDPTGQEDGSEIPRGRQAQAYASMAEEALLAAHEFAAAEEVPLSVIGFSTGGTLATGLGQLFADKIDALVLIAPLLRLRQGAAHWAFSLLGLLPGSTSVLDRWPIGWREPEAKTALGWRRPGHARFMLGNVQALVRLGRRVGRQGSLTIPTQIIATDIDKKVDLKACLKLAKRARAPCGLFRFGPQAQVPHAMLTEHENANAQSRATLNEIVARFILTRKTTTGATP